MPKNEQNRIDIPQSTIELTGCKIADKIEELTTNEDRASMQSKAFDYVAPNGKKIQVQFIVTELEIDFLPDHVDLVTYYE